jgi:hypothetical protein
MKRTRIILLLVAVVAVSARLSFADARTYQFTSGNRPFLYTGTFDHDIDAQVAGTFDLVMNVGAGTAQLTNINAHLEQVAHAPPYESNVLTPSSITFFDRPFSALWPTDMSALTGHFIGPDLLEFDGPTVGIYYKETPGYDRPAMGLPTGGFIAAPGYSTVMRLQLDGDAVTINALAEWIFVNDAPYYYLLNARATAVPEPASGLLFITVLMAQIAVIRRR